MKKKLLGILLLALLIFLGWRFFFYEPKMYMYSNPYLRGFDKIKVEIPTEIVKSKDCTAFKKYADEKMGTDFVFSAGCPWAKIEEIGHFILNGVEFNVPREYLWQGGRDQDGLSEGLYLMLKYPSFEASSASGDQAMNVNVTIIPELKELYHFNDKIWVDGSQEWYLIRSGIEYRLNEFLATKDLNRYILDAPEMEMKVYLREPDYGRTYFTGDLLKPDYWIDCIPEIAEGNPRCESSFMYKGNNRVRYTFDRKDLMLHHKEIKRGIEQKLNEFTQGTKK